MHFWALPLSLWTALVPCHGFSVDVEQPFIFKEPTDSFGQSVALLGGGAGAGLIVSAPLQRGAVNETGKIYKCTLGSGKCLGISIQRPTDAVNMSLGLSLATRNSQILACGPTVHQACGNNMYMKGYCFLLDQNLKELQRIPETLPECTKRTTDIVFLIDGSGSVSYRDFQRMKTFVSQIMTRFEHSDTLFSLVQFSTDVEIHFDFNEFRSSSKPTQQVMEVLQQRGWTNTITAIKEVLRELFVPGRGSRPEAAKVLIVVTDGKKTEETSYSSVISEAQKAGIIRYAIGVGNAFSTQDAMQELKDIASDPDSDHVFRVNDFSALQGIQDKLHEKIFAIEGTQSQNSSSFQLEMSQEGFSALLSPDGSVLGAVGAYDWSGGIFLYGTSGEPTFINMSHTNRDMNDAYLGYSAEVVQLNKQHSYVVGAPRHNHIGKAILFRQDARSREWRVKDEAVGTQVGSYFGATLCTVDLNKDTNTDLILIGAPMYHDAGHGGRVYVCPLTSLGELSSCNTVLQGQTGHLFGRFGASMAQLGDISGDGRTDVVIGAPLENDNQGAVYVFQGTRRSINTQYSQRIEGSEFPSRLRFFGQAVSGGTDLMGDGLADVAVGALGQVLLLRSRPVLRVGISISFIPPVIPIAVFNCQGQEQKNQKASSARVCFTVTKGTKDALGDGIRSTLRYTLTLDPGRPKPRAAFNSISPSESKEIQIGIETKCETFQIILPTCIEDTLNPLVLRVNYTLTGLPIANTRNLRPILSQDSALQTSDVLPFEKNCGTDGKCDDVLQLSFNFSGLTTLVVGLTLELNVTVHIQNSGEDSYSTVVHFRYPPALSYRKVTLLQSNRKVLVIKCSSAAGTTDEAERNSSCAVNHPIFWGGAEAVFVATFHVAPDGELGDRLKVTGRAHSENGGPITGSHQEELPIKYAIYLIVTSMDESTRYVNFSAGQEGESQSVVHRYEVKNLRDRSIPVSLVFCFPVKLNGIRVWDATQVTPSKPHLAQCNGEEVTPSTKDFVKKMKEHPLLDCSVAVCQKVRCSIPSLRRQQPLEFTIKGNVSFAWLSQTQQQKVTLLSSAKIEYDQKKYDQKEGFIERQVRTVVEHIKVYNYLPVIIGSSVGGLILLALITAALYKLGFFKRQYKQMMDVPGEGAAAAEGAPQAPDVAKQ